MEFNTNQLGPYELIERLGHGGMGVVYRAWQASLERMIALKVLPRELESDEHAVRRFRQEGTLAARLKHNNIVAVYDAHVKFPPYYIAMEFLEGQSLSQILLDRGRLEPQAATMIMMQVLAALEYAHSHNIIHRDIKPANIMIDAFGKATVTDFGLARVADQTHLTAAGAVFGSPDYMSPEQAKGLRVDHRTDIYSAGIVLYKMLTGREPFINPDPLVVMYQVINDPPCPPRSLRQSIPLALEVTVLKALEKDPRKRFQSAREMMQALQVAMSGASAGEKAALPKGQTQIAGLPAEKKRMLGVGLATIIVLMGIITYVATHSPPPPPPRVRTSSHIPAQPKVPPPNIPSDPSISIEPRSLRLARIGLLYQERFSAKAANEPVTWSIIGRLPNGLALDSNGFIRGRPRAVGNFPFSVTVTDSANNEITKSYDLIVARDKTYLVVFICRDSGKLLTKWCPRSHKVRRRFEKGKEPKGYCQMHTGPIIKNLSDGTGGNNGGGPIIK